MNWIDFSRAFVRPYLAYSGWTAILVLAIILAARYASPEIANMFIGALLGTTATVIGFYVRDRVKK